MRKLLALSIAVFALYLFITYKNSNNAENMGNLYNQFQNDFGQDAKVDFPQEIETLFASGLKKIANGQELVADRGGLLKQLQSVKEMVGKWSIKPRFVIPSANGRDFTIRYRLETEQAGKFDIISVLSIDSSGKIFLIDEVYYQIQDS